MSLHSIRDVNSLSDPLKQYQVTFTISNVRGTTGVGGAITGSHSSTNYSTGDSIRFTSLHYDARDLELRCTSFTYPGTKLNQTELNLFGHYRKRATVQDKSGTWKTKIIEDQQGRVLTTIQNWIDLIHNPATGIMSPGILYTSLAQVKIESADGFEKKLYLRGLYPISINEINIDASSSAPIEVNVDWNYDWFSEEKFLGI